MMGKSHRAKKKRSRVSIKEQRLQQMPLSSSSSLSRDEKRLIRDQDKISKRPKRPRYRYSQDDLHAAVEAYQSKRMTLNQASSVYGVPRTTLHDKANNLHPKANGRPFLLPEVVENDLAALIRTFCGKGNVLEESYFVEIAQRYVSGHQACAEISFQAHRDWLTQFLQRHDLKRFEDGTSKTLGVHRIISTSPELVDSFIGKYRSAYQNYIRDLAIALNTQPVDLTENQIRQGIFAIDETSISNGTPLKYEPKKLVDSNVFCLNSLVSGQSKVSASLLEVFSASGQMPFHVLTTKQKLTPAEKIQLAEIDTRSNLLFCDLSSGHFDSVSHAKVLEKIGLLRPNLPSLVIQDCPNMHKGDISLAEARKARIHLVCLPHNSSWYLQVPDDPAFCSYEVSTLFSDQTIQAKEPSCSKSSRNSRYLFEST